MQGQLITREAAAGRSLLLLTIGICLLRPAESAQRHRLRGTDVQQHREVPDLPKLPVNDIKSLQQVQARLKFHFEQRGHKLVLNTPARSERGIIIPAGGRILLTNAFISIKVIRDTLKSELPIEVFYNGEEEAEPIILSALQGIRGVSIRDASQLPRPQYLNPWPLKLDGYALKVFSLFSTGFREVLMLDADNQLLVKPDALFQMADYQKHGAMFWPDYWKAYTSLEAPKEGSYEILGLPEPWASDKSWACVESGQLLFNKRKHMDALNWTMFLNLWSVVMYNYVLGDKETFEQGFMLAQKHRKFYRIPTPPRAAMTSANEEGLLLHVGIVQSVDGRPWFLHRVTGGKFDPDRDAAHHMHPMYFTEPMSVMAAKQYEWHTVLAINTLHIRYTIGADSEGGEVNCRDLDPVTFGVLRQRIAANAISAAMLLLAKGFAECKEEEHSGKPDVPITLLPLAIYGEDSVSAINAGFVALDELRALLQA